MAKVTAKDVLTVIQSWVGKDKRRIIDLYNAHRPLARGYAVKYTDAWCDATVSAVFITLNAVDAIGGTECGVEKHIQLFKAAGIWEENGNVVPEPGWIITYNWDDGTQPNDGVADHIGIVESVAGHNITVIEGNYNDAVRRRTIPVGWGYIRGYAKPKYSVATTEKKESTKTTMNGIDISSYQRTLVPRNVPCDFIIVKATQGTGYFNPYFESHAKQVLQAGKLLGIYHYANGSGVQGEVDWFLRNIKNYVGKAILCLDWENIPHSGPNRQFANPAYAKQFMDEVKKRTGVTMFVYGSKDNCFNAMDWSVVQKAGYQLWGAQYANTNVVYGYQAKPWQSTRPWGAWGQNVKIHQYTDNLRLSGYNGGLDGNIAYMTESQWSTMRNTTSPAPVVPTATSDIAKSTLLDLVIGVQEDKFGKGDARKKALGSRYDEVQSAINHIYSASADTLAREVMTGKYGNGETRKAALGSRYDEVQAAVDRLMRNQKSINEIAKEVLAGKWGNEPERTKKLRSAGYDSVAVQKEVNKLLGYRG